MDFNEEANPGPLTPVTSKQKGILLVIDWQNGLFNDLEQDARILGKSYKNKATQALLETIKLIEKCRKQGNVIAFIGITQNKDDLTRTGRNGFCPEILDAMHPNDMIFKKTLFSAFNDPEFSEFFNASDFERITIAGQSLRACVKHTLNDIYDRGLGHFCTIAVPAVFPASGIHDPAFLRHTEKGGKLIYSIDDDIETSPSPFAAP